MEQQDKRMSRVESTRMALGLTKPRSTSRAMSQAEVVHEQPRAGAFTPREDLVAVKNAVLGKWINLLLLFVPLGFLSHYLDWSPILTFFLNFLAMMPLASILGDSTESLAEHLGETIGGLLNATFGNAVEIVIMILALVKAKKCEQDGDDDQSKSLLIVVQTSLIGSIFSNALLVLGCSFVAHGYYYKESKFNVATTSANVSLLMISSFVMIMPAPYAQANDKHDELFVSRAAALILLVMYALLLVFVLYTHRHLGNESDNTANHIESNVSPKHAHPQHNLLEMMATNKNEDNQNPLIDSEDDKHENDANAEEDEGDEMHLSLVGSAILLLTCTTIVAVLSEFLVDSIEPMSEKLGMSEGFVGIILLPIIGNAVEHLTAIRMAMKNKMDISLSIAIGSATQVSMFVVPFAIIVAWMMNLGLALDFPDFEVQLFIYSSIIIFALISDGSSNWLEGSMLLCLYILIGVAVWDQEFD